ncbi:MAG: metallophosphoesterase [Acidimicrobiales bacterium]|nr:metallophosphoesterase [Acidimicrobiales bacterium]
MKLVVLADVHLDRPFRWAGPELARRLRQHGRDAVAATVDLALDEDADALLLAGDLYEHELTGPDTAAFLQAQLARLQPIPVLVAPGNHDWLGPTSLYRRVDWSPNVVVFTTERLGAVALAEGFTVWGGAHLRPAGTPGFLDRFHVEGGGVHVALFHGAEQGSLAIEGADKVAHAPFRAEQVPAAGLAHAFVGHHHRPVHGPWHSYPGNPAPLEFGEDGVRGALVATVAADGAVTAEHRRVAPLAASFVDIDLDVTGCSSLDEVRGRLRERLAGVTGVARVTVTGELAASLDLRLPDLEEVGRAAGLHGVVVRPGALHPGIDVDAVAAQPTVAGRFVQLVRARELRPDVERHVLLAGLRALAGRDDLEVV